MNCERFSFIYSATDCVEPRAIVWWNDRVQSHWTVLLAVDDKAVWLRRFWAEFTLKKLFLTKNTFSLNYSRQSV